MFKRRKTNQVINYYKPTPSIKMNNIFKQSINQDVPHSHELQYQGKNNGLSDYEGLSRAYNSPNSIFIDGNRMFIAGTHNARDVYDDLTKIPFWGDVRNSQRYKQANSALDANPQVDTIISHSLGGSVSLELNKQYNNQFKTRTYGAPVLDFSFNRDPNHQRFRHPGDRISMFDTGAVNEDPKTIHGLINPHTFNEYDNIPDNN